jgi:hypothetical protein
MARVESILPMRGTIQNITYYKLRGKYFAKRKSSIDPERIAKDPVFLQTRQSMAEFARAGKAGRLIRTALTEYLGRPCDYSVVSRLTKTMMMVIKSDPVNERGMRTAGDGKVSLLKQFSFNMSKSLRSLLRLHIVPAIDPASGMMSVSVPAFAPHEVVNGPSGASHFRIVALALELDFQNEVFIIMKKSSPEFASRDEEVPAFTLTNFVTAQSDNILLLLAGIEFLVKESSGKFRQYGNHSNALEIVETSGGSTLTKKEMTRERNKIHNPQNEAA